MHNYKTMLAISMETPDMPLGAGICDVRTMLDELKAQRFAGNMANTELTEPTTCRSWRSALASFAVTAVAGERQNDILRSLILLRHGFI